MSDITTTGNSSFRDRYFKEKDEASEKERKFILDSQKKQAKLLTQITEFKLKVADLETSYQDSLSSATADSVRIYCQLLAAQEELRVAEMINNELFPRG